MATIPGLSYSLNLLCGVYTSSFDVNIFLGPVSPTFNLSNPSLLGSFVDSIWLEPALPSNSTNSSFALASITSYSSTLATSYSFVDVLTTVVIDNPDNPFSAEHKTSSYAPTVSTLSATPSSSEGEVTSASVHSASPLPPNFTPSSYAPTVSTLSATPSSSEGEVTSASVLSASPLPPNYTRDAKTASSNLTDSILTQYNLTRLSQLSTKIVVADLVANLTWVLGTPKSKTDNASFLPVVDVPIRFWVTSQQVTPETGKIRNQEILWEASENKLGGLRQGELPEVELQVQQTNLDEELALQGQDADQPY